MKLRELLTKEMESQGSNHTELSRDTRLNVATIKRALTGDAKLSVYNAIADALDVGIKFTVEGK